MLQLVAAWCSWLWSWFPGRRANGAAALPPGAERRESVRYGMEAETPGRLMAIIDGYTGPVQVRNISAGGMGLLLDAGYATDTILRIQLLNRTRMYLCKVELRVTYMLEHPNGEWVLGGSFSQRLGDDDLRALLA